MQLDLKFIEMEEVWKDVIGYEGLYQVSNLGRVKSLERVRWNGRTWCKLKGCILAQRKSNAGYLIVNLRKDNKHYGGSVHRLVAMAFIPNSEGKPEVDHIDTNPLNNCVANLRWVTRKENSNNPLTLQHHPRTNTNHKPVVQLTMDGKYIRAWDSARVVEKELGIFGTNVCKVIRGLHGHAGGYKWMYLSDYNKEGTVA